MEIKKTLAGLVFVLGMCTGDKMDVLDKFYYPLKYRDYEISEKGYEKPFSLKKEYTIDDKGFLEVRLGNDYVGYYRVNNDMSMRKPVPLRLMEEGKEAWMNFFEKSYNFFGGRYDRFKSWLEDE